MFSCLNKELFPCCLYFIFILSTEARFLHSNENINKNINNKKYLINIIHTLNRLNENLESNNNEKYQKLHASDNTEELTDLEKEKKLQEILWLIKTNYNAQKQYDLLQNPLHSGARLYLIRNPEAIDEYKNYLEEKKTQSFKNKLQLLRRKTVFGNNEDTYEGKLNERKLPVDSMEIHNNKKIKKSNADFSSEKTDLDVENDLDFKKKRNRDAKFDNLYDKTDKINKKLAKNNYKIVNNREKLKRSRKSYDITKTTKFTIKKDFQRKDVNKPLKLKPKIRFNEKPKSDKKHQNRWSFNMRTSIPYVGKKGIYDDE